MTVDKEALISRIQAAQAELTGLLEGMDYCLDWKPEPQEWCAREVVYHLLTTPPGGLPAVLRDMLQDNLPELTIVAGETNVTPERQEKELEQVRADIDALFQGLLEAVSSASAERLEEARTTAYFPHRDEREERSA
ncbi:MAG: DinB family protein, partial [Dehalococcoidia bacterium]